VVVVQPIARCNLPACCRLVVGAAAGALVGAASAANSTQHRRLCGTTHSQSFAAEAGSYGVVVVVVQPIARCNLHVCCRLVVGAAVGTSVGAASAANSTQRNRRSVLQPNGIP
jgi:hypothetical protein